MDNNERNIEFILDNLVQFKHCMGDFVHRDFTNFRPVYSEGHCQLSGEKGLDFIDFMILCTINLDDPNIGIAYLNGEPVDLKEKYNSDSYIKIYNKVLLKHIQYNLTLSIDSYNSLMLTVIEKFPKMKDEINNLIKLKFYNLSVN